MADTRIRINWERFDKICEASEYNKAKLSGLIGRSDSYLSQAKRTTGTVSEHEFELLCALLRVNKEELVQTEADTQAEISDPSPGGNEVLCELRKQTELLQQIADALMELVTSPGKEAQVKSGKTVAVQILSDMIKNGNGRCKKEDFYSECAKNRVDPNYIDRAISELGLCTRTDGFKQNAVTWILEKPADTKTVRRQG